jgi:hypothetical protein
MTSSIRLLISLISSFGVFTAHAGELPSVKHEVKELSGSDANRIVSDYLAQWDWGNQRSLAAEGTPSSFTDQLHSGGLLLNELRKPGHERVSMAYVLYETRQAIRTVEATIAETPKESEYLLPSYRQRLDQLRSEAVILEQTLKATTSERPNKSLERTHDK